MIALWALGNYELLLSPPPDCAQAVCDFVEFSAADVRTLRDLDLHPAINHRAWSAVFVLYSLFTFALAGLIFWRKRNDWMALLVALNLIYLAAVQQLAVDTYERGLAMYRSIEVKEFGIGPAEEIPSVERKLTRVGGRSIGVFHHGDRWYAVRNYCLHRSGPVATGPLEGDVLTCPWHGYQYDLTTGEFIHDLAVKLEIYPVEVRDGTVYVQIPTVVMDSASG